MVKVALVVGVSEYKSGLPSLPSAVRDAQAMQRVLQDSEMGGFDEVNMLTNPTREEMEMAIYHLFHNCQPDDLVLFYFSGHGVKDQYRNFYLTTSHTQKESGTVIPPTAVNASYLQTQLTNSRSKREVIILDCCFSGAFAEGLTVKDDGEVEIKEKLGGEGRAILTSSTSVQYSFEQEDSDLSIYTQYLVEGITTGAADLDNNGSISADELHEYARQKVKEKSPAMTPQFYPVEEGYKIYLAKSPQDDPKLKYRKEAQKYVHRPGQFSRIGRKILVQRRIDLALTQEEAEAIEADVLRPYREYQQKLQEYEQAFREEVEENYPLSEITRNELKDFQKVLGLRDKDVAPIEVRILPSQQHTTEAESQPVSSSLPVPPQGKSLYRFEFDVITVNNRGEEIEREHRHAEYFPENLGNGVELEMVAIPGGEFLMGAPEGEGYDAERPQHKVSVPPFFMGKYPVTQAQWRAVASLPKVERDLKSDPSYFKGNDRPVEKVSWYDAVEFCQRLSKQTKQDYRLPSEAEWEYACRAGTTTPFHFGETITTDLANYRGTDWEYEGTLSSGSYEDGSKGQYREKTTSVGNFLANAFGLYDLHGNVWEWCTDNWHDSYEKKPEQLKQNGNTPWSSSSEKDRRIVRGGSWGFDPRYCRSAYRIRGDADFNSDSIGFRVCCAAPRTL